MFYVLIVVCPVKSKYGIIKFLYNHELLFYASRFWIDHDKGIGC